MTANEMAIELDLKLDRSSSFGSPGYEDFELTSVLTEAERLYIKKFIDRKNNRKSEGFDETEFRNQGLSALIKKGAVLPVSVYQTDSSVNGKFFDLPVDFMYTIHEEATIDKTICNIKGGSLISVDVIPVGYDEISRLSRNKYKKPYYKDYGEGRVWRLVYSRKTDGFDPAITKTAKRHELVTDGSFVINSYSINYLQNPKGIIVDTITPTNQRNCILDDSTHNTIIDIATSLMLERVKEQELRNVESFNDVE